MIIDGNGLNGLLGDDVKMDDIQQRITVGQAFNIEAQRVLNNAKVCKNEITSEKMNAEIKAGMVHTVANIQSHQESYVNAINQANQVFNKAKTEQDKDAKNASSSNSTGVTVEPVPEQAFEV